MLLRRLLNFFFPRACAVCAGDVPASGAHALCDACWEALPRWGGLTCAVCGVPLPDGGRRCRDCRGKRRAFRCVRSAGLHEGGMRTLLKKFKYGGRPDLSRPLARMLTDLWAAEPSLGPVDAVVPVPLHWTRERLRGYNQARVLAQAFAKKAGLPVLEALKRRRPAPSQTSLDKLARAANVRDAFQARRPEAVRGKTLLLVDDVCTTGATLEACARALKAAGARRVSALTAARQVSF